MQNAVSWLETELAPGERLLWSGRPKPGLRLTQADVFLIPFSLAWLGFAVFWELMILRIPGNEAGLMKFFLALFGIPFLIIGLYLAAGRFVIDARKRAQTACGITSRRVLVITRGPSQRQVKSLELPEIHDVVLEERRDRAGTVRCLTPGGGVALDFIPAAREAFETLQRARAGAGRQAV